VGEQDVPNVLKKKPDNFCIVGLSVDAERLFDIRTNRLEAMKENKLSNYSDPHLIQKEIENSKKLFKRYNWPVIDVTKKSVEETAASIIKIFDIKKRKKK